MAWQPSEVVTVDGRTLMSDSTEWLQYCEASTIMKAAQHIGQNYRSMIEKMRGKAGLAKVEAEISRIEPAYILSLPDRDTRRAYLAKREAVIGSSAKAALEQRILALHAERQAAATAGAGA